MRFRRASTRASPRSIVTVEGERRASRVSLGDPQQRVTEADVFIAQARWPSGPKAQVNRHSTEQVAIDWRSVRFRMPTMPLMPARARPYGKDSHEQFLAEQPLVNSSRSGAIARAPPHPASSASCAA